jgi:hypothetical protein
MATIKEILTAKGIADIPIKRRNPVSIEAVVANGNTWIGPAPHLIADSAADGILTKTCTSCGEPRKITEYRHTRAGTRGKTCIHCIVDKIAISRQAAGQLKEKPKRECTKCHEYKADADGEFINKQGRCKECRRKANAGYYAAAKWRKLDASLDAVISTPLPTFWQRVWALVKGEPA